jgi:hypothetical protein
MCGVDGNTDATPGDGHATATAEEMIIVLRHHGRMVALRERQTRERSRTAQVGGRSVNAVSSQPTSPLPSAGGTTGRADSPPQPQLEPAAVASSPRGGEPAATASSKRKKKKVAATSQRVQAAQATVTERSLVPYVPTALLVQHGPPLALNWIIIEGDQPPLLSKGEFDRAVIKAGARIVSTDDTHSDVTVYVMTTASGASITHVARKSGSYSLLKGDYDNSGNFVTSPNGKQDRPDR